MTSSCPWEEEDLSVSMGGYDRASLGDYGRRRTCQYEHSSLASRPVEEQSNHPVVVLERFVLNRNEHDVHLRKKCSIFWAPSDEKQASGFLWKERTRRLCARIISENGIVRIPFVRDRSVVVVSSSRRALFTVFYSFFQQEPI